MYISIHYMQQAASSLFFTVHRVKMSKVTCELITFNKTYTIRKCKHGMFSVS